MADAKFPEFVRSTEYRRELGMKRKRAIRKMYSDIAAEIEKKIRDIEQAGKWSGTTVLQMKQLRDLQKSVNESLKNVTAQIEKDISSDIRKVAEVTCADVAGFMQRSGVRTVVSLAHVPETAVKNIISGNIYGQRWNFSEAIWGDYKKSTDDLAAIVSKGLAAQKPIYDIAKDLEKYVNPAVRKDYDWSRIYPGTKKKSDYNAARLAITMSTHAHQQAVILSCREEPMIDGVEWRTSGGNNVCPLCEQRNGEVFPLDKCPMDHPMGVCVLIPHYKGMKTDKETGRVTGSDDFYERNSEVDEEKLRTEFEKEKERLRAEREAKNAAARAAQEKAKQNAAELLERAQKSADQLDKAVREVQEKVKALQEAAKGLSGNVSYMSKSFRPVFSDSSSISFTTGNAIPNEIQVKRVINSKFNMVTDVAANRRDSAVRIIEKQLTAVSKNLPDNFEIPLIAVVDFESNGLNSFAIGGYDKTTDILYINRKYDSTDKILKFVNSEANLFANKTEFAPLRHELGHKFYEDCIKGLAKSENLSYNKAKEVIDNKIYEYVHMRNNDGRFLIREISGYAQDGFDNGKYTEVIAESFSVYLENLICAEIIDLLMY